MGETAVASWGQKVETEEGEKDSPRRAPGLGDAGPRALGGGPRVSLDKLSWQVYEAAKVEVLRGRVTHPEARLSRGHSPTCAYGCGCLCECSLTALSSSKVIASNGRKHSAFRGRVRGKEHAGKAAYTG